MQELITLEAMRARGTNDWRKPTHQYRRALINNILECAAHIVSVELDIADTDLAIDVKHINPDMHTATVEYSYKGHDLCRVSLLKIDRCEYTVARKAELEEAIQDCCLFLMKQKVEDEATMLNELT